MSSLFKTMTLERITVDDAEALLQLPRTLGTDPSDGQAIIASNGRYGPYVQKGKDFRSIQNEEQLLTITLAQALEIFSQPKVFRRGGGANMAAKGPLREFGDDPVSGKAVVAKDGKFGVYVTDGETNASLAKGDRLEAMPPERAYELLAIRREAIIEKGGPAARKATATKKAAATRAAPAKKAGARKAPAKKAAATKKPPAS
jgi:DNA topoisomerase-1